MCWHDGMNLIRSRRTAIAHRAQNVNAAAGPMMAYSHGDAARWPGRAAPDIQISLPRACSVWIDIHQVGGGVCVDHNGLALALSTTSTREMASTSPTADRLYAMPNNSLTWCK